MRLRTRDAVADADAEIGAHRTSRSIARRLAEAAFILLFFAVVLLAALPMGANRDWAWSPIVVLLGALAVWHALGLGIIDGHVIRPAERQPLIILTLCFLVVVVAGIVQISPFVPPSWRADLYGRAASVLGHPVTAIVSLNADATRSILMKIAACGAIFVMARATCRDRRRARLFLVLFLTSSILVTSYGLLMQATNGSCYVFSYSKRSDIAPPGREFLCALSGTFVNSNSYAAYAGMALVTAVGLIFSRAPVKSESAGEVAARPSADAWLSGARVVYLAMSLLLFGGLLLSESRAGFSATVLAAIALGALLLRGRWPSHPATGWALIVAILVGAMLALIAGSALFNKMAKLSDMDVLGRFRLWQVVASALEQAPWFGWGLGSFPDLYPLLQPAGLADRRRQGALDTSRVAPRSWHSSRDVRFAMVLVPLIVCLAAVCAVTLTGIAGCCLAASMVAIVQSFIDFSLQIRQLALSAVLLGLGWAQSFRRYE